MKLKHIAKGTFLDMLKSSKLRDILRWLIDNEFYIHYFNLNIIYWSILDIVDSIIGETEHPFYYLHHMQIKSDFYEVATVNREYFLQALTKFNYPDVSEENRDEFCRWLIYVASMSKGVLPDFNQNILLTLMKEAEKLDGLPFIHGFEGGQLISEFMIFYLRNLYLFKNSRHIFDEENHVEKDLEEFPLTENGVPVVNYVFVKSHEHKAIQVSDVIAGFLGKYFTYLKNVSDKELVDDVRVLNSQQKETLCLLGQLIDVSDKVSRGFFNVVSSEGEQRRHQWILTEYS